MGLPTTRPRNTPCAVGLLCACWYDARTRDRMADRGTPLRTSFVFGSQELYDWVDDNPRVRMLRTETTNSPAEIARQPAMTSINTALQVDLFDQANASRVRGAIYSGLGGQSDFNEVFFDDVRIPDGERLGDVAGEGQQV